jgi:UMP-CMP kinase
VKRLLGRALTSGREDDNEETIKNRIQVFFDNTTPTLYLYNIFGKVFKIDAIGSINAVYNLTKQALLPNLTFLYGPPVDDQTKLAKFLE